MPVESLVVFAPRDRQLVVADERDALGARGRVGGDALGDRLVVPIAIAGVFGDDFGREHVDIHAPRR